MVGEKQAALITVEQDLRDTEGSEMSTGEPNTAENKRQLFRSIQSFYKSDEEKFHGRDDEDVVEFLETYESLCSIAEAPDTLISDMFPFILAGAGKDFYRMMPKEKRKQWEEVKKAFEGQYASAARRQRLTQRYQLLRQKTSYGLDSYYKELMDVTRQLPDAYRVDDMIRDKFISGLHPSIRKDVTMVDPPTLQAAYDRAKLAVQSRSILPSGGKEQSSTAPWRKRTGSGGSRGNRGTGFTGAIQERSRGANQKGLRCYNCGKSGHTRRDCRSGPVCYNCGRTGHVRANCTRPPKPRKEAKNGDDPQEN